ncbi:MAG: 30S ribosomal protein S5 [Patescibacteria group bacterium]
MAKKRENRKNPMDERDREFEQKLVDLARVTRVTKGGKRMNFRATMVIGDKKGRVGFGIGKAGDVSIAISKAVKSAKKKLITVPMHNETIPHEVLAKYCSGKVMLKPAVKGKGIKAGGVMRTVLGLSGVPNVTGKILGSSNKINTLYATFLALSQLRNK